MNWKLASLTLVSSAALAYLYLQFVWVAVVYFLPSVTAVGDVIVTTMMARVLAVVAWPRLRRASPILVADLLGLEALALPVLLALTYLMGEQGIVTLTKQVFVSWVAALLIVAPSVMIFRYARSMYNGAKLSTFLPSSAFLFGVLLTLLAVQPSGFTGGGLDDLLGLFVGGGAGLLGGSGTTISSIGDVVASVAVFFSVALYCIGAGDARVRVGSSGFLIGLVGILAAVAWGAGVLVVASSALVVFTLPTAAIGGTLWWLTREKKA